MRYKFRSLNTLAAIFSTIEDREAIERATCKLNPLLSGEDAYIEWEDDDELIR